MNSMLLLATLSVLRQVTYPGADFGSNPIPKFDRGFLLFLREPCELIVYQPTGKLHLRRTLQGPRNTPCSPNDASIAPDGTLAVSISYNGPQGLAGGILLLDSAGNQTGFVDTGRYMPVHIGFGRDDCLWSIGWQRDEIRTDSASKTDYALVRRYSRTGAETGAFIPRSLWKTSGEPASESLGYWGIAFAKDRIGAMAYESFAGRTREWVEWDYNGKLLARIPLRDNTNGGKAYTSAGSLYAGVWDPKSRGLVLSILDRETGEWKPVGDVEFMGQWRLLLGADGDDLVFKSNSGITELIWARPQR